MLECARRIRVLAWDRMLWSVFFFLRWLLSHSLWVAAFIFSLVSIALVFIVFSLARWLRWWYLCIVYPCFPFYRRWLGFPLFGLRHFISLLRACLPYSDVADYEIYPLNILTGVRIMTLHGVSHWLMCSDFAIELLNQKLFVVSEEREISQSWKSKITLKICLTTRLTRSMSFDKKLIHPWVSSTQL